MYDGIEKLGADSWNRTWYPKAEDAAKAQKTWYVVDASSKKLGRLASAIAVHIRGKNLPEYTPSFDMGAYVIVVRARERHAAAATPPACDDGLPPNELFVDVQKRVPERIVEHAVKGMLPKGRLGRELFRHLKVYKGPDHPHTAQQPIELPIHDRRCTVAS
eukprot:SM000916S24377  [mRNA]  locus=s916:61:975:+ [translate_table: standard]